jgi:PAS domain S-box-containing protein
MDARSAAGRDWHLNRWQTLLFAVALAATSLAGWLAWREARLASESVAWVQHTFRVLQKVDALTSALVDAETGLRGFLLTGESTYLEPYRRALPLVMPTLDALRDATSDNPEAQRRIAEIAPVLKLKLAEMERTLERAREAGPAAGIEIVRSDAGIRIMDELRHQLGAFRNAESELLHARLATRDAHLQGSRAYSLLPPLLGLALLAVLIASINHTMRRRHQAERGALESGERLRVTLESIGDAVIATDVSGHVTYMNPVAEALTGWRRADAQALPLDHVFRIVNEFSRDVVENPVSKVMREGGVVGLANHTLLIARDGSERPIDDSGAPIRDADGRLMGVVLVFRDVSARRLSEQARERLLRSEAERESAETASRAKDEFLAVVSHELRSPLTAALSWMELMKGDALVPEQRPRALDTIERNLRHQAVLVSDLLDVSRIIAGKLTLERLPIDLAALVRDVVNEHRAVAQAAGVALRHEPVPALIALADPERIRQVLANLLVNAIRFTPSGGSVDVLLAINGSGVELAVRDTGRGIAAHQLPRIFERFHQGDPAAVREHGGLGLGLSIARHLVESHGGTIAAESDGVGRGATFRVRIPLHDGAGLLAPGEGAAPQNGPPSSGTRLSGVTLLLVEDHADTRDAVVHLLRMQGARVLVAGSVAEALALIRSDPPTLLVSDLGLPNESGLVLIERVRALDAERGVRTPAIVASGFASGDNRGAALAAGFDAYLSKPIDFNALLAQISSLLAR